MLPKHPLRRKPKPGRGLLRRRVQIIALPLKPAITQFLKDRSREEIHGLCGSGRALQERGEDDEADFDDAVGEVDAEEAEEADWFLGGFVDYGVEEGVFGFGEGCDGFCEGDFVGEGAFGDVCPQSGVLGLSDEGVQVVDVFGVQWFQLDGVACDCGRRWWEGLSDFNRRSDWAIHLGYD